MYAASRPPATAAASRIVSSPRALIRFVKKDPSTPTASVASSQSATQVVSSMMVPDRPIARRTTFLAQWRADEKRDAPGTNSFASSPAPRVSHTPSEQTTTTPPPSGAATVRTAGTQETTVWQSASPRPRVTARPPGHARKGPVGAP